MGGSSMKRLNCTLTGSDQYSTDTPGGTPQAEGGTKGIEIFGKFVLRLRGTFVATVYLQRSDDDGTTWDDVTDSAGNPYVFNAPVIVDGEEVARDVIYRFGIKGGGWTSGTVQGSIQQ